MSFFEFIARDIALDANGELLFENGDIVIRPSDAAHVRDILESNKGEWRFAPLVGTNAIEFLNATGISPILELKRRIQLQLEYDGYQVNKIDIINWKINVEYKRIR